MEKIDIDTNQEIIEELEEREWNEVLKHYPKTKELLPYEILWTLYDCPSPHGNDTGFDVLAEFIEWNETNSKASATKFLTLLCEEWEIDISNPYDEDYTSYRSITYFHSIVSLSIAVVKERGVFDTEISQMAIEAIDRYLKEVKIDLKEEYMKEVEETYLLIREVLLKG
jgi:uncharacterized protein YfeS